MKMSFAGERLNVGDSCFFQKEILKIATKKMARSFWHVIKKNEIKLIVCCQYTVLIQDLSYISNTPLLISDIFQLHFFFRMHKFFQHWALEFLSANCRSF